MSSLGAVGKAAICFSIAVEKSVHVVFLHKKYCFPKTDRGFKSTPFASHQCASFSGLQQHFKGILRLELYVFCSIEQHT